MKPSKKFIAATSLVLALAIPGISHAFFFFIPFGLFNQSDQKAVEDFEKKKDWKSMLDLAEVRLKNEPKNPVWLYIYGLSLQRMSRIDEAIQQYKLAIAEKSDYKEALLNLGQCQLEKGSYDESIATATDLIGKAPEVWQAYYNIAMAYTKKRDSVNARVYLEQLRPRNIVFATQLEDRFIKPLEAQLEQEKTFAAEKDRQEREQREFTEAQARADADTQSKKAPQSVEDRLKELKQLHSKGLLSKDAYEIRQREILKGL